MPKNPLHVGNCLKTQPAAPATLSPGAHRYWGELVPLIVALQTARPADNAALVLLVELLADVDILQNTIRAEGVTTDAGSGGVKAHPGLRNLEASRRQVQTLLDRFGLMPSGNRVWDNF